MATIKRLNKPQLNFFADILFLLVMNTLWVDWGIRVSFYLVGSTSLEIVF